MTDTAHKRRHIPFFLIKILIVLIFPLEMVIAPPDFRWTSLLLVVSSYQFPYFTSIPSLLTGLIIILPCIFFERMLYSSSISRPVRKHVVASCILSCGISLAILLSGVANPPIYILFQRLFYSQFYLHAAAVYAPILGISFFVVLPLILRESTLRTISADYRQLNYQVINPILQKRFKREKGLSVLLWFSLLFCPFMLGLVTTWWPWRMSSMSVFYIMQSLPIIPSEFIPAWGSFSLVTTDLVTLPITVLLSSIRFVFARDVFRFQKRIINGNRLASAAILGEILPSAIITLLMLGGDLSATVGLFILPTPILPIAGLALIKLSRTNLSREEIWPDYESRMWYEQGLEPYATESADESIKVPLTYLLISKVRKLRNKET